MKEQKFDNRKIVSLKGIEFDFEINESYRVKDNPGHRIKQIEKIIPTQVNGEMAHIIRFAVYLEGESKPRFSVALHDVSIVEFEKEG